MSDDRSETAQLLQQAAAGDRDSLGLLLTRHRERLRSMVALRLDRRLQGRIDPSDVVQEACLEAFTRFTEFLRQNSLPFYLWLRLLTTQRLLLTHRQHLDVQARNAGREVSFDEARAEVSTEALAAVLVDSGTTPSQAAVRAELRARLQEALGGLEPLDREVLALRHFEQLSNAEAASVLGLKPGTASQRYYRALKRLKDILAETGLGGP